MRELSETEIADYREMIRENIGYDALLAEHLSNREMIDEIVELMTETVCSRRACTRKIRSVNHLIANF